MGPPSLDSNDYRYCLDESADVPVPAHGAGDFEGCPECGARADGGAHGRGCSGRHDRRSPGGVGDEHSASGPVVHWGSTVSFAALLLFAASQWYSLSLPALILLGLGTAGFSTMQASIVLLVARRDVRDKALSVVSLAIGTSPIGALIEGAVADWQGPGFALGLNAAAGLICMALVGTLLPVLRRPNGAAHA